MVKTAGQPRIESFHAPHRLHDVLVPEVAVTVLGIIPEIETFLARDGREANIGSHAVQHEHALQAPRTLQP
jgi:hypothetical protein